MSPILDLQNLTPISLEDLGEIKQEIKKELDKPIEPILITKEPKPENKKPFIKKDKTKTTSFTIPPLPSQDLLLSIKDCETLSSISKVSIRKAIKEKEINYILEDGKYKISFKELLKWCYSSTRRKNVFNTEGIGRYVNEWKNIQ